MRIDVQDGVVVTSVGTAYMDDIAIEHFAVLLIEVYPGLHQLLGLRGVVELRSAVAGLYAGTEKVGQTLPVVGQMVLERFDGGSLAAALVFYQRYKHPSH